MNTQVMSHMSQFRTITLINSTEPVHVAIAKLAPVVTTAWDIALRPFKIIGIESKHCEKMEFLLHTRKIMRYQCTLSRARELL
jgi:hypothetical protein